MYELGGPCVRCCCAGLFLDVIMLRCSRDRYRTVDDDAFVIQIDSSC